ncbi:MAG TPA: hypothetical protein VK806_02810 [Bacteroidia bacterium]|jgi:hypothetical protein|nr:hypothetical protein [Bacteroidia bacterium]
MQKSISIWLRTIAGIMLFAMLYYVAGYRVVSFLIMHNAKSDAAMAMKFDKASLQNLAFNTTEYSKLKWIESGKEFSYNGQLYDVVSNSKADGINTITVYADKNETRWAQALNDFVKQFFPSNSDTGKGMKTAEAMVSAFQKEYTPLASLNVRFPSTEQVKYFPADREMICMASPTGVWHPPTQC